jgi:hypothetical protein
LTLVVAALAMLASFVIAFASLYPHFRDRRDVAEARAHRERRLDETADAVLGREAVPDSGIRATRGMIDIQGDHTDTLKKIQRTVGTINGSGKPLAQSMDDLTTTVRDHMKVDDARFDEIDREITKVKRSVADIAEGRSH